MRDRARPSPLDGLPRALRAPVALLLAAVPFVLTGVITERFGRVSVLVALPLLAPLFLPLLTPALAMLGVLRYYSRFLVAIPGRRSLGLHLGTGFDRIVHRRALLDRRALLRSVVSGLLAIVEDVREGRLDPATRLEATSFFFHEKTALSLGFSAERPTLLGRAAWLFGAADAVLWLSVSRGRLEAPRAPLVRAVSTAARLVEHEARLRALEARLLRGSATA